MPTREQTIQNAIRIFEHAEYPDGLSPSTCWLGIYQAILWYEPIGHLGYDFLPHIIDSDKLRPSAHLRLSSWRSPNIWQRRADAVNSYLAQKLNCTMDELPGKTDLLLKQPGYLGLQRQNVLGTAFVGLVKYVLERFGSQKFNYRDETEATSVFPGISFPGRSVSPRIDILIRERDKPRIILSAKWSLRHDRLSDITNECPIYKAAFERIYRSARRDHLLYYVVTNEFDPARLNKVIDDSCVDGVIHVHKTAVTQVCDLNGRLEQMVDLGDFITKIQDW